MTEPALVRGERAPNASRPHQHVITAVVDIAKLSILAHTG